LSGASPLKSGRSAAHDDFRGLLVLRDTPQPRSGLRDTRSRSPLEPAPSLRRTTKTTTGRKQFLLKIAVPLLVVLLVVVFVAIVVRSGKKDDQARLPRDLGRRELAFVRPGGPKEDHIVVGRADGSGLRQLEDASGCKQRPVWSPDGKRIAYRYEPRCDYTLDQVVLITVRSGRRVNVSRRTGIFGNSPSWSPTGRGIAFAGVPYRGRGPVTTPMGLFVGPSDGTRAKRITPVWLGEVQYPAWSPDGKWIAFQLSSAGASGFDLYKIRPTGHSLTRLTRDGMSGAYNEWPMWSPDSGWIAYGVEGEQSALWVMRADGSAKRRVRSGIGVPASWAPGSWLVANCGMGICAVPLTGGSLIPLLHGREAGFPAWRPRQRLSQLRRRGLADDPQLMSGTGLPSGCP
jgi:Tol biopolymer transport system component